MTIVKETDAGEAVSQWAAPSDMAVAHDELRYRLDIHEESIVLYCYEAGGAFTRLISADDLADAFTQHIGKASGLLPPEALWWKESEMGPLVALWRPPRVWPIALREDISAAPTRLRLPMPGLVFICSPGQAPWVFAAKRRLRDPSDRLFMMPAFNVFRRGGVCPGTHKFPVNVEEMPESFFAAFFSLTGDTHGRSQAYPNDLRKLWSEIDGMDEYPVEDLVDQCSVEDAMALPRW